MNTFACLFLGDSTVSVSWFTRRSASAVSHCMMAVLLKASLKWIDNVRDVSRQKLNAELSAMSAATAQLVTLTAAGPDNMDYIAVNSAIQAM